MAKTNAEKQKDYRERKKLVIRKEKDKKSITLKLPNLKRTSWKSVEKLLKKECDNHELRRKHWLRKSVKTTKVVQQPILTEIFLWWWYLCSSQNEARLPEKGKRRSGDRLHKKIAKLKKEKQQLSRKCDSLRKKLTRSSSAVKINSPLTPKRKTMKMMKNCWNKSL